MPKRLKDLVITKVSLVPKGANPDADVTLFKSAEPINKVTYDEVVAGHPEGVRKALWAIYDAAYTFQNTAYANMMGGKNVMSDMEKSIEQFTTACMDALAEVNLTKATKKSADDIQTTVIAKAREFLAMHTKETPMKKREEMSKEELLAELERVEKAKATPEPAAPTMTDIMKMPDLPDVVKKALENQNTEITNLKQEVAKNAADAKAANEARELQEMTTYVEKELKHLPGKSEDIAKSLIAAKATLKKEDYDLVVQSMKAGSAGISKALAEEGLDDTSAALGDAYAKLEGIAKELQKADPKLTKEQAFAKAVEDNKDLYLEHRAAQKADRR